MILEYTSNTEDNLCIYQESKFLFQRQPDQPDQPDQSTPSYPILKNPNVKA